MKRYITGLLMAAMLTVAIPALATTSFAQTRGNNRQYYSERRQSNNSRYQDNSQYYDQNGYYNGYKQPNVYDRHRKAINLTVATGAGAIIGALIGGKKGALIGAGAGVAAGAIVTAKQRPRNYNYRY